MAYCNHVPQGVVTSKARNFLGQALFGVLHQIAIALVPQIVTMGQRARNAAAGRFDGVFGDQFGVQWRQLAMPIGDFPVIELSGDAHSAPLCS